MSDNKVIRVATSEAFFHGREPSGWVYREKDGRYALVPWETWELSKSHFIEMDKKLGQLQHALGEERRKNRMPYSKKRILL